MTQGKEKKSKFRAPASRAKKSKYVKPDCKVIITTF